MAHTAVAGPRISAGDFSTAGSTIPLTNPDAGPDIVYQGDAMLDIRAPINNGADGPFYAFLDNPRIVVFNTAPAAASTTIVAAAQTGTSGSNLTLGASGSPLRFIKVTYGGATLPSGLGPYTSAPTVVITGTSGTAATATATLINGFVTSIPLTALGQGYTAAPAITFTGGGLTTGYSGATATAYLAFQRVTSIPVWPPNANGSSITATAYAIDAPFTPLIPSRVHSLWDITSGIARNLRVVSNNTADTNFTVFASGYDVYGRAMTETIAVSAGTSSFGIKGWKYVATAQVRSTSSGSSTTGTISIGTGDRIGLPLYTPVGELIQGSFSGSYISSTSGWTVPDTTNPATSGTGDPRGTYQLQGGSSDGIRRLYMAITMATNNTLDMNPNNTWPLVGVTPA